MDINKQEIAAILNGGAVVNDAQVDPLAGWRFEVVATGGGSRFQVGDKLTFEQMMEQGEIDQAS